MNNQQPTNADHASLDAMMQAVAGFIINDLHELQNCGELAELLQHSNPEIRQEAARIFNELSHIMVHLGRV